MVRSPGRARLGHERHRGSAEREVRTNNAGAGQGRRNRHRAGGRDDGCRSGRAIRAGIRTGIRTGAGMSAKRTCTRRMGHSKPCGSDFCRLGRSFFRRKVWKSVFLSYICSRNGGLAQLARALAWHARGHEFDSRILHKESDSVSVTESLFFCVLFGPGPG